MPVDCKFFLHNIKFDMGFLHRNVMKHLTGKCQNRIGRAGASDTASLSVAKGTCVHILVYYLVK